MQTRCSLKAFIRSKPGFCPTPRHQRALSQGLKCIDGRGRDVPELSAFAPYDPFKVDIFIIGNMVERMFLDEFTNVGFLLRLHESMTQRDPARRPDSQEASKEWQVVRSSLWQVHRKWRLRSRCYWLHNPYYDVESFCNISTSLTTEFLSWGT